MIGKDFEMKNWPVTLTKRDWFAARIRNLVCDIVAFIALILTCIILLGGLSVLTYIMIRAI